MARRTPRTRPMKPCSAYCRPDEGVHCYVDTFLAGSPVEWPPAGTVGCYSADGNDCIPDGVEFVFLSAEPAPEAPPNPDPMWVNPHLVFVRILR